MPRVAWSPAILTLALLFAPPPVRAGFVTTFDLQQVSVTPTAATFNVLVTFPGAAGDSIQALQISVAGSGTLLTAGGTDFSRFAFVPNTATLPGWQEFVPVSFGVGLYAPLDPLAGPFLGPSASPITVGTLTVNLAGLPGGQTTFVTLAGGAPGLETDAGGVIGGMVVPSFAADPSAGIQFTNPNGESFVTPGGSTAVPAPGGLALALTGAISVLPFVRRKLSCVSILIFCEQ